MTNKIIIENFTKPTLGSRVRYLSCGEGQPIIFISGWLGTAENFIPVMDIFPRGYKCISLDLPGFGKSTKMDLTPTTENYAVFLKELTKKEMIDHPVFVGISFGASILLAYSVNFSEKNDKMVLQSPSYKPFGVDLKTKTEIWLLTHFRPLTITVLRLSKFRFFQKIIGFFGDKNVKSISYEYLSEYGLKNIYKTDTNVLIESLKNILNFDFRNSFKKVKGKILLIFGSEENLFSEEYQKELYQNLTGYTFKIIKNGTHYAMMQKPKQFVQIVTNFLKTDFK